MWRNAGICREGFDFRCGSKPEVSDGHENVRSWGESRHRFRAVGCLLVAMNGLKTVRLLASKVSGNWCNSVHSARSPFLTLEVLPLNILRQNAGHQLRSRKALCWPSIEPRNSDYLSRTPALRPEPLRRDLADQG